MFGENMKAIMKQKKITSRTLAPAIGISETYVSYLLNGKKSPTFKLAEKNCRIFRRAHRGIDHEKRAPAHGWAGGSSQKI